MKIPKYVFGAKFQCNVFFAGRMNCGKKFFVQKLAVNNFFGKLIQAKRISKISLKKKVKDKIQSHFDYLRKFHYSHGKCFRKYFRVIQIKIK